MNGGRRRLQAFLQDGRRRSRVPMRLSLVPEAAISSPEAIVPRLAAPKKRCRGSVRVRGGCEAQLLAAEPDVQRLEDHAALALLDRSGEDRLAAVGGGDVDYLRPGS